LSYFRLQSVCSALRFSTAVNKVYAELEQQKAREAIVRVGREESLESKWGNRCFKSASPVCFLIQRLGKAVESPFSVNSPFFK